MDRQSVRSRVSFINREESWLKFNWRVLEEAEDLRNPLLERVKFLAISASNLDEFFEVRVGGLLQQLEDGQNKTTLDGLTMAEERDLLNLADPRICGRAVRLLERASAAGTGGTGHSRPGSRRIG